MYFAAFGTYNELLFTPFHLFLLVSKTLSKTLTSDVVASKYKK